MAPTFTRMRLVLCAKAVASRGTRAAAPPSTRSCTAAIGAVELRSRSSIVPARLAIERVEEERAPDRAGARRRASAANSSV